MGYGPDKVVVVLSFSEKGFGFVAAGDGNDVVLSLIAASNHLPVVTLLATGSVWKYLDNGSDQGSAWREAAFNDDAWRSGPAKLGSTPWWRRCAPRAARS